MGDIIVLSVLGIIVGLVIYSMIRNHKKGKEMEEKYGEHAQYLWDILYGNNEIVYIDFHREEDEEAKVRLKEKGKKSYDFS